MDYSLSTQAMSMQLEGDFLESLEDEKFDFEIHTPDL